MARDYSWARNSIPPRLNTIGEVAGLLALGRHQTRRRLIASGLPYKVYVRRWQDPGRGKVVLAASDRDSSKNCCGTDQTGYDEFVGWRLEKILSSDQIEKHRATSTDQRIDSLDWRNRNGPTSGSSGTANPPQKAHDPAILSSRFGPSKEGVRDSRARLTSKSIPPYSVVLDHRKSHLITTSHTFLTRSWWLCGCMDDSWADTAQKPSQDFAIFRMDLPSSGRRGLIISNGANHDHKADFETTQTPTRVTFRPKEQTRESAHQGEIG